MSHHPSHLQRYAVAIAAVVAAFALRYGIYGTLDDRLAFAFFVPATIIAAWYGGLGPGLLAAVSGLLLGDYFFLTPHYALGPVNEAGRTAIGLYAINVTLIVVLFAALHARLRDLEDKLKSSSPEGRASPASQPDSLGQTQPR